MSDLIIGDLKVLDLLDAGYPVAYPSREKSPHEIEKETLKFKQNGYVPTAHGWKNDPRSSW